MHKLTLSSIVNSCTGTSAKQRSQENTYYTAEYSNTPLQLSNSSNSAGVRKLPSDLLSIF